MAQIRATSVASLVIVGSLGLGSPAFAQDLLALPRDHPEIRVISTVGETTTGVLRRFDASTVTLDIDGDDRVFHKSSIANIYQDDPLKNGMLIGLASGLAVAVVATIRECGSTEFSSGSRSCSGEEAYFGFGLFGALFGGAGLGIGAAVDALVHRENLLFRAPPAAQPVTLHLDRGAARLAVNIRW